MRSTAVGRTHCCFPEPPPTLHNMLPNLLQVQRLHERLLPASHHVRPAPEVLQVTVSQRSAAIPLVSPQLHRPDPPMQDIIATSVAGPLSRMLADPAEKGRERALQFFAAAAQVRDPAAQSFVQLWWPHGFSLSTSA